MLKKIFKTIFIFMLILGITIPSNAAVSVSDNSAFITKAEALAVAQSLSERIIVLENTMDNKIDNLITAYLERNGVWNPQEQTLVSESYYVIRTTTKTGTNVEVLLEKECVKDTTKSGIFSCQLRYRGTNHISSGLNYCRMGYAGTISSGGFYSNMGFDLMAYFYEDNTEDHLTHTDANYLTYSDLRYSVLIGSAFGQAKVSNSPTTFIACMNMPTTDMIRPVTFFVQKGSTVWWRIISAYRLTGANSTEAVSSSSGGGDNMSIKLVDAIIN